MPGPGVLLAVFFFAQHLRDGLRSGGFGGSFQRRVTPTVQIHLGTRLCILFWWVFWWFPVWGCWNRVAVHIPVLGVAHARVASGWVTSGGAAEGPQLAGAAARQLGCRGPLEPPAAVPPPTEQGPWAGAWPSSLAGFPCLWCL